jgi:hypothetical protein
LHEGSILSIHAIHLATSSVAFGMLVRTVLAGTLKAKFTLNVRVQEDALVAIGTGRKVFAVLFRVHKWTVFLGVQTIWEMLASYLSFCCTAFCSSSSCMTC